MPCQRSTSSSILPHIKRLLFCLANEGDFPESKSEQLERDVAVATLLSRWFFVVETRTFLNIKNLSWHIGWCCLYQHFKLTTQKSDIGVVKNDKQSIESCTCVRIESGPMCAFIVVMEKQWPPHYGAGLANSFSQLSSVAPYQLSLFLTVLLPTKNEKNGEAVSIRLKATNLFSLSRGVDLLQHPVSRNFATLVTSSMKPKVNALSGAIQRYEKDDFQTHRRVVVWKATSVIVDMWRKGNASLRQHNFRTKLCFDTVISINLK